MLGEVINGFKRMIGLENISYITIEHVVKFHGANGTFFEATPKTSIFINTSEILPYIDEINKCYYMADLNLPLWGNFCEVFQNCPIYTEMATKSVGHTISENFPFVAWCFGGLALGEAIYRFGPKAVLYDAPKAIFFDAPRALYNFTQCKSNKDQAKVDPQKRDPKSRRKI